LGQKIQKFRPNVVLADAIYSGLSALVRLSLKRKNTRTIKFYNQIESIWENVRKGTKYPNNHGSYDFSSVQSVEPVIRGLYLQMLWHSTRRYGNKEFKRVYNWREGTIGPLNALLNFAGSALRDILVPRYPFPDPQLYQIRDCSGGSKKIIPMNMADKIPLGEGISSYLKAGYRGNSKNPRVMLSHPTLPALDFGDMIRAHLVELCRQCFIHGVPRSESQRYIRLLVHRLIPFLDWVYTRGKVGRKDFYPDADRELRKIVLEIRTQFSRRAGFKESISKQIDSVPTNLGIGFLKKKFTDILNSTEKTSIKKRCRTVLNHIKHGRVTDTDVSKFVEEITKKTQQEGNNWHRVLLSGYSHPRSLKEAVFAGDYLLQTPSGIQYLAEVPVVGNQGAGKIDLVLFVRTERSENQHIWTPVMILEVKSKTGFNFNLYGKKPRTRKPKVYVPVLNSWKTPLKDSEWDAMLGSVPPEPHLDQLDAYEKALLSEYNALVNDPLELKKLWKGVVIFDVSQDYESTKRAFDELVDQLATKLFEGGFRGHWKTLKLESKNISEPAPYIAIMMSPNQGHEHILKGISFPTTIHYENPFAERVEDKMFFTQYISVPSPISSGKSAAWLAKNWHLLNHLAELEKTATSEAPFFWIDLLGDYPNEGIVNVRFGLNTLKKKRVIRQAKYDCFSNLLKRIKFVSTKTETDSWLFDNSSSGLVALRKTITSYLHGVSGNRFVVIDGWPDLERMIPTNRRNNLQILEITLLQVMKELAHEVIWVDGGVGHPQMSETYQRPCVSPSYYNSPRRQVVDEIIWNLPTSPQRTGWMAPQYDDSRVIIQDLPTEYSPWTAVIHVPYLKDWTRKFSAAASRNPIAEADEHVGALNQETNMYGRSFHGASIQVRYDEIGRESLETIKKDALGLVPSLCRPRGEQFNGTGEDESSSNWISVYHPVDSNKTQPSLSSRLHLDPMHPPTLPNRLGRGHKGIHVEAEQITRGWIHKEHDEPDVRPSIIIRRPSHDFTTNTSHIDTLDTKRREIHRLSYAATFLRDGTTFRDPLFSLYQEITNICDYESDESIDEDRLLDILVQVRDVLLRRPEVGTLWLVLLTSRLNLGDALSADNQRILKQAQRHNVELLELYGMNLFLAVLSVADKVFRDVESPLCLNLWSAVAAWQFYQMGFEGEDDEDFQHRYDFQAIHANLTIRAKQIKTTTIHDKKHFPEKFGQLLWREESEGGSMWLLFPSLKNTIYGGLMNEQASAYLRHGWYRCVIDPQLIKKEAASGLSREGWDEQPIVLVNANNQQILFTKMESVDGEEWTLLGVLEYGNPPKGKCQPVRWIRLSQPLPETLVALHGYSPSHPPDDIRIRCDRVLQEATEWSGIVREVSCVLTINAEKKVYRIDLTEGSNSIARKETPHTNEIIRFLRYPQRTGEYFSTKDGTYLKWNPQKDVSERC
jgi:hypothetical protein